MRKRTYFDPLPREGWPDPKDLEPYFLAPPGQYVWRGCRHCARSALEERFHRSDCLSQARLGGCDDRT